MHSCRCTFGANGSRVEFMCICLCVYVCRVTINFKRTIAYFLAACFICFYFFFSGNCQCECEVKLFRKINPKPREICVRNELKCSQRTLCSPYMCVCVHVQCTEYRVHTLSTILIAEIRALNVMN